MTFSEFKYYVKSDCYREYGDSSLKMFLTRFRYNPVARLSFFYRLNEFVASNPHLRRFFGRLVVFFFCRAMTQAGTYIDFGAQIGPGLLFVHHGGIWISGLAVLGSNCTICHGVTIGKIADGPGKGAPTLGDNVYLGPGAVVSGKIQIGNHAMIGANSLVMSDVPDYGVVIGVPGKLFSKNGSALFVHHTDYGDDGNSVKTLP